MRAKQWPLYVMLLPSIVFLAVFMYAPMYGVLLAFKSFTISGGINGSPLSKPLFANFWFLKDAEFWNVFQNTIKIAGIKFITAFPAPIILTLLINEVVNAKFKKAVQTVLYLPHFISWVIFSGIIYRLLGSEASSPVNQIVLAIGGNVTNILSSERSFVWALVCSNLIKESGWGTIIYLAAISSADKQLYEAAMVDGAGHWRQMVHITIPHLVPIITILLILAIPGILSAGFDQVYNMQNAMVARSSNILDIYILKIGIQGGQYSYGIAVGFVVNVLAFGLVMLTNKLSKQTMGYGLL